MAERTFFPARLSGSITVPPSKSETQRAVILASLFSDCCAISGFYDTLCDDVLAVISLCEVLGRSIVFENHCLLIDKRPDTVPDTCYLRSSAASFRMGLPLLWTLNKPVTVIIHQDLSKRVLNEAKALANSLGFFLEFVNHTDGTVHVTTCGSLKSGIYHVNGSQSSQWISGMLMALSALKSKELESQLIVDGSIISKPYITLTCRWLERFHISVQPYENGYLIPCGQPTSIQQLCIPGDWSQAAVFFAAAGAYGHAITVQGLEPEQITGQGDCVILHFLRKMGCRIQKQHDNVTIRNPSRASLSPLHADLTNYPDLFPPVAILCAKAYGTSVLKGTKRLIGKECNRLEALLDLLAKLHVAACYDPENDSLSISGRSTFHGNFVFDTRGDHRMAMAAAIAALNTDAGIAINDDTCLNKSWPGFIDSYQSLGGCFQ